ncbi:hypothetical protein AKJ09_01989 [Labilithrix luteola]|uniref:HTH luxR-type domain-containing protein n=1 Tax=Labilithrix luteola TaxID=1391654 RepID=A0A0K1PP61_9BACT|nr:helix-turn-helix transcriptional regulator [Labilithrix luteola]AKU95325.1 hypothetical protein AKJ09_01989 [Labilithrix luteola]
MKFVAPFRHASTVLEAAYDVALPTRAWLQRLLRTMAVDLDGGFGVYALALDLTDDGFGFVAPPVFHRLSSDVRRIAPGLSHVAPPPVAQHFRAHMVEFGSVSQLFGASVLAPVRERALPFVDSVGLSVQDGEGTGLQIISPMPDVVRVHGRSRSAWRKLGLHLGIAWRLRRRLERGGEPEALIHDGKLVDARGNAKPRGAREALIEATRRIERARTKTTRDEPEHVLDLWRGLVSGRWSLVDRWDSDGRRYIAAYENGATVGEIQGFSSWEIRVLQMHLLRAKGSEIAFALGLSPSTVERVLSNAARRIGLRNRAELVRLSEPRFMRRFAIDVGRDRIDVLRFEDPALPAAWQGRLTKAQLDVATAAAHGLSDGEIARHRGTSVRTVSNLLAATYRALGLEGRGALVRSALETARRD